MKYLFKLSCFFLFSSCTVTSHTSNIIKLGKPFDLQNLSQASKGPILFQKMISADWAVKRSGLINLKDPKASALKSGDEPIQIYFYAIDHPKFGRYLIDTGISKVFRKDPKEWPISAIIMSLMNTEALKVRLTTDEWLNKDPKKIEGIFLTHLHLDHILGSMDFQPNVPMYVGPKEATNKRFLNLFVQKTTNRLLGENPTLYELSFQESQEASPFRALDFFGDQSLLIFHMEGHTKGSLAFLVQSSSGYQLVLGDSCHTSWGWENDVTPGDFTEDQEKNRISLDFLKNLASKLPEVQVHPGHQSIIVNSN
ncbi:MBL fold metallo-hydrolase [Leptospira borgpetersenii]|uniref:Hydrolase n=2 Tax=Leptospira TaxID=171 RepID=A0A0S2IWM0_LEPBO|nr:MBL fold metallo-hydrolase [Leptospira borgpetersenii]ALO28011.1 hydrolase [Leptospira borgpetersenii serovar Ballum]ANH02184.2 Hydrolase [Leptospira borgpetersenii str. 4E]OOV43812.1 hydrolase [Leptospira borgpetersenii serovar Ballum]